jgi:hypothetical protein
LWDKNWSEKSAPAVVEEEALVGEVDGQGDDEGEEEHHKEQPGTFVMKINGRKNWHF